MGLLSFWSGNLVWKSGWVSCGVPFTVGSIVTRGGGLSRIAFVSCNVFDHVFFIAFFTGFRPMHPHSPVWDHMYFTKRKFFDEMSRHMAHHSSWIKVFINFVYQLCEADD